MRVAVQIYLNLALWDDVRIRILVQYVSYIGVVDDPVKTEKHS